MFCVDWTTFVVDGKSHGISNKELNSLIMFLNIAVHQCFRKWHFFIKVLILNSNRDNSVGPYCLTIFRQQELHFELVLLLKLDCQECSCYSKHLETDTDWRVHSTCKYLLSIYKVPSTIPSTVEMICKIQFLLSREFIVWVTKGHTYAIPFWSKFGWWSGHQ